jgi:hypothetical protein
MSAIQAEWITRNQGRLLEEMAWLRACFAAAEAGSCPPAAPSVPLDSTLGRLAARFDLSRFEVALLALAAGVELDKDVATACEEATGHTAPSFSLALRLLPDSHWSAIVPQAPLRRFHLVEVLGSCLTTSPVRIDERILHFLTGIDYLEPALAPLVRRPTSSPLQGPEIEQAERVAAILATSSSLQLTGALERAEAVLSAVAAHLGVELFLLALPADGDACRLDELAKRCAREVGLTGCLFALPDQPGAAEFLDRMEVAAILLAKEARVLRRPYRVVEVRPETQAVRACVLTDALGVQGEFLNGSLERMASQFRVPSSEIRLAASQAEDTPPDDLARTLWDALKERSRSGLDGLAQRVEVCATLDDVILPASQRATLREIILAVRHQATVLEQWGWAAKSSNGLGIAALFAGPSGTGKTMAAEAIAHELDLDLYRVDLSQVVNKYLGETEKNLGRIFDAADQGGAILLFDEADTLFGKRTEVRDSHDRYANLEVGYLLQRMEAYRGLAILTTNHRNSLDPAFLRRLRFVVTFPFPEAPARREIWSRVFPSAAPVGPLNVERLAQLNLAGGNIRNIALAASFLAAEDGKPIGMEHLLRAAKAECAKLERPLSESKVRGW